MRLRTRLIGLLRRLSRRHRAAVALTWFLGARTALRLRLERRPLVVVLSLGREGHSYSAARAARGLGLRVLLVSPRPVLHELAYSHYLLRRDPLRETEALISTLRGLNVEAVLVSARHMLLPAQARIADALGLVSCGEEAAALSNDKLAWRRKLAASGLPQPRFAESHAPFRGAAAVRKPASGTGSKGVIHLPPGATACPAHATGGKSFYEAYVDGPQYDVEGVSWNGRHRAITIVREGYHRIGNRFPPRFFMFNPPLAPDFARQLEHAVFRVLDASCVRNGAWHVESRICGGDILAVDFANRMGYERLVTRATGVDFARQHVTAFVPRLREPVSPRPRPLLQFFAHDARELEAIRRVAKAHPGNVFDLVLSPFPMGPVTCRGMVALEAGSREELSQVMSALPLSAEETGLCEG